MKGLMELLFFITIFTSCSDSRDSSVNIDVEKINNIKLSEVTDEIKLIRLETNPDCLIKSVIKVKIIDDKIFISENNHLLQFNYNGKFIKQIGRKGRGPGEYSAVLDFCLDTINRNINVLSLKKIIQYNEQGEFVKDKIISGFPTCMEFVDSLIYITSTYYSVQNDKYHNASSIYLLDSQLNLIDSIFIANVVSNEASMIYEPQSYYFSISEGKNFFYFPVSIYEPFARDTLYKLTYNKLDPYFKFVFSEKTTKLLKAQKSVEGITLFKNFRIKNIYKQRNFLFIEYEINAHSCFGYFDETNNKFYNMNEGIFDDIYNTGKIKPRPLNSTTYNLYFTKNAYEVRNEIEGLNENDNPVLMLVKLKE